MKVEIEVPRTFDITLKQMDKFLTVSGWSEKQNHNELTCKYQCIKYPNVFVVLPKAEGKVVDEENMMFSALRLIAHVNNNCGIETIVNRVLGEHKRNEPLNKRSNKGDDELKEYCVEYAARLWVKAENINDARDKANEITNGLELGELELNFPDVERV